MCNQCETTETNETRRGAIWDVPQYQLCTVIGTCMDMNQLRRLKSRFKKHLKDDISLESDYDLHACCVSVCCSKNALSKSINKMMNSKFAQAIQEIRSLKDDVTLRQRWLSRDATDFRRLIGYYWAILTSPRASAELKDEIYGEVHLISHISGQRSMVNMRERELQNQQMQCELDKKERTITRKKAQIDQFRNLVSSLEKQVCYLSSDNSDKATALQKYQTSPMVYEQIINSQMLHMDRLQTRVDKQKWEIADLRNLVHQKTGHGATKLSLKTDSLESAGSRTGHEESDLRGKRILYVGGFARHRNKFQKMTEKINGCFLYHDGGVQQSVTQLDELVKCADAIFCPIDCISHGAVDRIKAASRNELKDCVFLRSASLSSFKNRIVQYASRV